MDNIVELDRQVLDRVKDIVEGRFVELVNMFAVTGRQCVTDIHQNIETRDIEGVRFSAHSFKSLCASMGLSRLRAQAEEMEHYADHVMGGQVEEDNGKFSLMYEGILSGYERGRDLLLQEL